MKPIMNAQGQSGYYQYFIYLFIQGLVLWNTNTAVEDSSFCLVLHSEVSMKLLTTFSEY